MSDLHSKVTAAHLSKLAYLYIRQSSLKQIQYNQESTKRQYDLRNKAISLGWKIDQIKIIDQDQGQSGSNSEFREGFQYLVSQVSMEKVGIVMGLEVSRLARNSSDWHRLLELCAITGTLILDEDGVYNPCEFNDRLLLGLKGTMSEAELHIIKSRLRGGTLNKAKRGKLKIPLPIGLIYNDQDEIVLDPDLQIQNSIKNIFKYFEQKSSAMMVVKEYNKKGLLFPRKIKCGINKGDLHWSKLSHSRVLNILHNPRYAGAFVFGRRQNKYNYETKKIITIKVPEEQWHTVIQEMHIGYISWEQYKINQQQLSNNSNSFNSEKISGPPRDGSALLQGIIICGYCGNRMTVRYYVEKKQIYPAYMCQKDGIENGKAICQSIIGKHVDKGIEEIIIELLSPASIEISIAVQKELEERWIESDKLWQQQLERSRYEVELARRRYMKVDPDNRMVANSLESEWNVKLKDLDQMQLNYNNYTKEKLLKITKLQQKKLIALSKNFSSVWYAKNSLMKEKKQILRLLIEDVTLKKTDKNIEAYILFKSKQTKSIILPLPKKSAELRKTSLDVLEKINKLTDKHLDSQIVNILNNEGYKPSFTKKFSISIVQRLRNKYKIKSYYDKLKEQGLLTAKELARMLNLKSSACVYTWYRHGLLDGYKANDNGEYLFEPIKAGQKITISRGSPLRKRKKLKYGKKVLVNNLHEV